MEEEINEKRKNNRGNLKNPNTQANTAFIKYKKDRNLER